MPVTHLLLYYYNNSTCANEENYNPIYIQTNAISIGSCYDNKIFQPGRSAGLVLYLDYS